MKKGRFTDEQILGSSDKPKQACRSRSFAGRAGLAMPPYTSGARTLAACKPPSHDVQRRTSDL